jgi:UDP-N-acetyl-2-amino-2-deoxyglucuronate dehydrogenase
MKNFALIGVGGFIAPRHLRAIKDTGNLLLAALDRNDSVGIVDSYFPQTDFFIEFERFDRHMDKLRRKGTRIDFVSICTPNYLHDAHIRFGLRINSDVICEKPLVLNPWNAEALTEIEKECGKRVYTILQLRLHHSILKLKKQISENPIPRKYDVDLTYITSRGKWYYTSWKGDVSKSGGIATNIGIHFFDMLIWIFGAVQRNEVHLHTHDRAAGMLELENARVRWFLSINASTLPEDARGAGKATYRSLLIDGQEFEFSDGFTELHTASYSSLLEGKGFSIQDTLPSIQVAHDIRSIKPVGLKGEYHPLARLETVPHPILGWLS